ncbi:hypothetical protein M8818_003337 [Zalaria obscura]|uniref:Uncharacterized protein n=1 Tax=Zalaria obscura TaxID=2024903 RepID=A0ACC3SGR9_9PEZI
MSAAENNLYEAPRSGEHVVDQRDLSRLDEENALREEKTPRTEPTDDDVQLVAWNGPDDPDIPFNWPTSKKWVLTITALLGTLTVLINGTAITVAAADINEEFGISDASFPNSYWPVSSWTVGGALFMMIFLPILEDVGMRLGYLVTYALFILFLIPQAVAQNFWTLVIVRFFAGGCVSVLANIICSIICDIWEGDRGRSVPMSMYITCYLVGSTIGPVIGGAIHQSLGWRWILWIQLIWTGIFYPIFFLLIAETRGPVLLRRRAKRIRAKTGKKAYTREELEGTDLWAVIRVSVKRPMYMLCTEWVVFTFTLWSAFSVGTVYVFTQSVEQVFNELYGFESYSAGYVQGAVVIGQIVGWFPVQLNSRWYFASAARNKEFPGVPIPEARLYMSILGGFVGMTGGMFVYAWTSYPQIHWIAPTIGLGMVGFGINVVVSAIADYVTDAYSKYAASVVAAIAFGENIVAAFLPLAASSMYTTLGFQWASSLLGFISLILAMAPVVLLIWGPEVRRRSPFMSQATYDARIE